MGDVIDEVKKVAKVSLIAPPAPIRRSFSSTDMTGLLETYIETVDANGSYSVGAPLASSFEWSTPLAAWEISNLSTDISSITTMSLSSEITLTLDSTLVKLGSSAVSPAVKGTELTAAFASFNTTVLRAVAVVGSSLQNAAAIGAIAAAIMVLSTTIANTTLSTKVMVE